ncbi:puromycin resistance protein Pur8 [Streptomyces coelicoflavus ZG0656]|nr:puromycin resistance protein Pur8 [Streptomyces coelicoflavus ZG0656]
MVAIVGGWLLLERTERDRGAKLDIPGTVLVTAGLFGIVYGFSNAESHDWSSPLSWGFLAAGAALLAVFAWWQTRAAHPLLPLRVLLDRNRGAAFAALLVASAGMFGVFLFLTYYLQLTLGFSAIQTGLAFLPMVATLMVSATMSTTFLLSFVGPKIVVPLGMALGAVGLFWLTTLGLDSSYASNVLPPLLVTGLGIGLVMAPSMSVGTRGVATEDAGVASASLNTMQQIGGSIGTPLLNTLAASAATPYLVGRNPADKLVQAQAAMDSYTTAFMWSALLFAAGALITALLFRRGIATADPDAAPTVHLYAACGGSHPPVGTEWGASDGPGTGDVVGTGPVPVGRKDTGPTRDDTGVQQWYVGSGGAVEALGKCLEVPGGVAADGTPLRIRECDGCAHQVPR